MIKSCSSSDKIVYENLVLQTKPYVTQQDSSPAYTRWHHTHANSSLWTRIIFISRSLGSLTQQQKALKTISRIPQSMASFLWNSNKSHRPAPDFCPAHSLPAVSISPILSTTQPLSLFLTHTAQRQGRTFYDQQINKGSVTKPQQALNTDLWNTNKPKQKVNLAVQQNKQSWIIQKHTPMK